MSDPFKLDDFLPYRLSVLAGRLSREYSQVYREKFGIGRAEWRVIAHLSQETAVSIREIHQRVDMDKSKVSRAAARLEEAGIITKRVNTNDRRLVELSLTQTGQEMMQALEPLAHAFEAEIRDRLGPDADGFLSGVERLLQHKD
ncbi:Transcriptional regulator, MarR family [Roseibacterium elongatum DSM 19469]|uniref:Transcriptional regulator, MarR family n=1 Tax=Roseicyclus elongatus DSM 19469 TaxID=1294273 RepID=W8SLI3_9RHOB|nr:MarR family transcriptional regulator [Roseibacterium elongatum]AHM03395.1 Transcriptional regulator, MarR family [Roseibacterium elongatum DSM 19469]